MICFLYKTIPVPFALLQDLELQWTAYFLPPRFPQQTLLEGQPHCSKQSELKSHLWRFYWQNMHKILCPFSIMALSLQQAEVLTIYQQMLKQMKRENNSPIRSCISPQMWKDLNMLPFQVILKMAKYTLLSMNDLALGSPQMCDASHPFPLARNLHMAPYGCHIAF